MRKWLHVQRRGGMRMGASVPTFRWRCRASVTYELRAGLIGTNGPEINIERVRQRLTSGTGHDLPLPEITRRWSAAQENLAKRLGPSRH